MPGPFGQPSGTQVDLSADLAAGYQQNAANKIAQARVKDRKDYTGAYAGKYGVSDVAKATKGLSDVDIYNLASSLVSKRRGPGKPATAPAPKPSTAPKPKATAPKVTTAAKKTTTPKATTTTKKKTTTKKRTATAKRPVAKSTTTKPSTTTASKVTIASNQAIAERAGLY